MHIFDNIRENKSAEQFLSTLIMLEVNFLFYNSLKTRRLALKVE